jgi:hypothetical protein
MRVTPIVTVVLNRCSACRERLLSLHPFYERSLAPHSTAE